MDESQCQNTDKFKSLFNSDLFPFVIFFFADSFIIPNGEILREENRLQQTVSIKKQRLLHDLL